MKCPNCFHNMRYLKGNGASCYFECPACGYTIGKPDEKDTKKESKDSEETKQK